MLTALVSSNIDMYLQSSDVTSLTISNQVITVLLTSSGINRIRRPKQVIAIWRTGMHWSLIRPSTGITSSVA